MKKRFTALLLGLCLLLTLLPATALAAENAPETLKVGNVTIDTSKDGSWTTGNDGKLSEYTDSGDAWNVHYDASTNTLTLNGATITGEYNATINPYSVGIYAPASDGQPVSLTIVLQGENEVSGGTMGIYVLEEYSTTTGGATLTIMGNGSLNASGSSNGIQVQGNHGDAALTIRSADVMAQGGTYGNGVLVQAGSSTSSGTHTITLSVEGGNLTASGNTGIGFDSASSSTISATNLTVSNNAIVRANGGISNISGANNQIGADNNPSGGIVFNGNTGIVYGNVTLQDDLTVGKGESLNIPSGASLTIPEGTTLTVNGGELTGNVPESGVIYKVIGVSLDKDNLVLNQGEETTLIATIAPQNATDQTVELVSSAPGVASVDAGGKVTAVAKGTAIITVKTADGEFTDTCSVTVNHTHIMSRTEFKDATCTEAGNEEYWTCETCGKYFSDADGNTEMSVSDTVISAAGHRYVNGKCTVCGAVDSSFSPAANEDTQPTQTNDDAKSTQSNNDTKSLQTNDDTKSPQTGRNYGTVFLIPLFAGCGLSVTGILVFGRKKEWLNKRMSIRKR